MDRMLRHIPTGDLYVFTSILAKRPDMEMVPEEEPEVVVEPVAAPAAEVKPFTGKKTGKRQDKPVQSVEPLSIDIEE